MTALASALALATTTGTSFAWEGYRRRGKGRVGFREGEWCAIRLFAEMSGARVSGGSAGETELTFVPGSLQPGSYRVELEGGEPLLALVRLAAATLGVAPGPSELVARGSTHDIDGDTFEVTSSTWIYLLRRMGLDVDLHLETVGFTPRGGGEMRLALVGRQGGGLSPLELEERAKLDALQIVSGAASLPAHVQQRQAARARSGVQLAGTPPAVQLLKLRAAGSGSVVAITGVFGGLPLTVAAISERGVSAESVGERAAGEFRRLLAGKAVLSPHFLPSLLVVSAACEERSILTVTRLPVNIFQLSDLVKAFTGRSVRVEGKPGRPGTVTLEARDRNRSRS